MQHVLVIHSPSLPLNSSQNPSSNALYLFGFGFIFFSHFVEATIQADVFRFIIFSSPLLPCSLSLKCRACLINVSVRSEYTVVSFLCLFTNVVFSNGLSLLKHFKAKFWKCSLNIILVSFHHTSQILIMMESVVQCIHQPEYIATPLYTMLKKLLWPYSHDLFWV